VLSTHIPFYNLVLLPLSALIINIVEIIKSPSQCRKQVLSLSLKGSKVGFVPTMGALHEGHLELVRQARAVSDFVVVSIFVNPTQFNNKEDFEKYPKTFDDDVAKLRDAGCDMVFAPSESDMYPDLPKIEISFPSLQQTMEGLFRPGHFEGVALVVSKLLHLVPAQKVFFGQKDWQQVQIIKRLVSDLLFDTTVVPVPTVRESDGLAMSSRNMRLTGGQREKATIFIESLRTARKQLLQGLQVKEVKEMVADLFKGKDDVKLEYFEIANRETLEPVQSVESGTPTSLFIAGFVGQVRLIDNIFLKEEKEQ
jgi:pantoate--beta-alanine ligase